MSYVICEQQRRSLISAFVVRCLDGVMSLVSVTKISSLMLASVAEQAGLSLTLSETPEDTFCHDEAHIFSAISMAGLQNFAHGWHRTKCYSCEQHRQHNPNRQLPTKRSS